MTREAFFEALLSQTVENTRVGLSLRQLPEAVLRHHPREGAWNALDCLEHLHASYAVYFPQFDTKLATPKYPAEAHFKHGTFRRSFIEGLRPKGGKRSLKMPTSKRLTPHTSGATVDAVFEKFEADRLHLGEAIDMAREASLNRIKLISAVGPLFRLRLGDTFLFLAAHDERHLLQAQEAIQAYGSDSKN